MSGWTGRDGVVPVARGLRYLMRLVVFEVRPAARPADGRPESAFGAQGTVRPIESGYYDTDLRRVDGEWKIVHHRILMDMPMAVTGAER